MERYHFWARAIFITSLFTTTIIPTKFAQASNMCEEAFAVEISASTHIDALSKLKDHLFASDFETTKRLSSTELLRVAKLAEPIFNISPTRRLMLLSLLGVSDPYSFSVLKPHHFAMSAFLDLNARTALVRFLGELSKLSSDQLRSLANSSDSSAPRLDGDFEKIRNISIETKLSGPQILALADALAPHLGYSGIERATIIETVFPGESIEFVTSDYSPKSYAISVIRALNGTNKLHMFIEFLGRNKGGYLKRFDPKISVEEVAYLNLLASKDPNSITSDDAKAAARIIAKVIGYDSIDRELLMSTASPSLQSVVRDYTHVEATSSLQHSNFLTEGFRLNGHLNEFARFFADKFK